MRTQSRLKEVIQLAGGKAVEGAGASPRLAEDSARNGKYRSERNMERILLLPCIKLWFHTHTDPPTASSGNVGSWRQLTRNLLCTDEVDAE